MYIQSLLTTGFLASVAVAWNKDVHQQIGYGAEEFLTPATKDIIQRILEPQYNGSIGLAASWADDYAHTTEGAFSYQWHWIDSSDNPPLYCHIDYDHDCPKGGCVISAIANQTEILRDCIGRAISGHLTDGSDLECSYALKWITHFVGDIAQPLHASGIAAGGNNFPVVFGNHSTELHAVWDGWIIYADANVTSFPNDMLQSFFQNLVTRIRRNDFEVPVAEWLACSDPSTALRCALSWARDSNSWTCDYVYSHVFNGTDLATSGYATEAFPIVELQVSKAMFRLGTWLNALVAGGVDGSSMVLQIDPDWL